MITSNGAKEEIKKIIERALLQLKKQEGFEKIGKAQVLIEHPKEKMRGDYSTSIAFAIAKNAAKNPFEVATILKTEIENKKYSLLKRVEVVNGFVNFFVLESYLQKQLSVILKEKDKFGSSKIGKNKKVYPVKSAKGGVSPNAKQFNRVNVEFISANPTGPLTLGNGRGGFGGDVLANVLAFAGYKVSREYYINDTGAQINKLGHSVIGDAEAVYRGQYIIDLKNKVKGKNAEEIGKKAAKIILDKMIKPSVKKMGIRFDKWFSETSLYKNKEVDKVIAELSKNGFTYESEGALWFKSKDLGDDKDRVLIRQDGVKTYFASDIAYLKNKFKRGFGKLVIFLGADHYGYVARLKAACRALGFKKDIVDAIVLQLVRLFEKGKEVRMSKRTGLYVTIDELIDEVGLDVARFFFLQRSLNTHFNFDMDLAKEKSDKNPIFKVQYAYARINSIIKKSKIKTAKPKNLDLLKEPSELDLIRELAKFPEIVEDTAKDYQLQRLPGYAIELAESFHKFYENCRVISEDKKLTDARTSLILATKIVLKNTLDLMGITAPQKM